MSEVTDGESVEAQFQREGLARCRRGALAFCGLAGALLLASIVSSWYAERAQVPTLLPIRVAALAALGGLALLLVSPLGARRPRELAIACLMATALGMHALAQATGGQASPQYDRLTLVLLAPAILMSWSAAWGLAACAAVLAVFVVGSAAAGVLSGAGFAGNLSRLAVASAVSVGAGLVRERGRWRHLWALYQLAGARDRAVDALQRMHAQVEQQVAERTALLRASESRFRAMFDAAPLGVAALDLDGRVTQANVALIALCGGEERAVVGRPLIDLCPPADGAALRAAVTAVTRDAAPPHGFDARLCRGGGSSAAVRGAVTPIRDASGRIVAALAILEDVSGQLQAEAEAGERQEHLAHVLRMATMGGMIAELAHELNQPLGAIVNFALGTSTRLRQAGAAPDLVAAVDAITAEARRAAEILRRVRAMVRPGQAPSAPLDLNAVVREAAQAIDPTARRRAIAVRLELDPAVPPLTIDRLNLEQVLLNLLRNAVDAIDAAPPGVAHEVVVRTAAGNGAGIEVQVRDTGVGLPSDAGERIFEAFYTTKPRGLGMGLSISRSIVEAYGGRLSARPNPTRGATFTLHLPPPP